MFFLLGFGVDGFTRHSHSYRRLLCEVVGVLLCQMPSTD